LLAIMKMSLEFSLFSAVIKRKGLHLLYFEY